MDGGDSTASAEDAPREVLKVWASEWAKEGGQIEREKLLPPKGFEVLSRWWLVDCTFAWLCRNRRMSKDYERLWETGEALVLVALHALWRAVWSAFEIFRRPLSELG